MPGFKNVGGPRFLGAGGPKKKGFIARQKAMPYYGKDSSKLNKAKLNQKQPKPQLPSWQDRNIKNRGSKLNK